MYIFHISLHFCPLEHSPPPNFPIYRTIPQADIFLTDGDVGVMACTVQYQNTSSAQEVTFRNEQGQTVVQNFLWLDSDDLGITFVPNSNLVLDTSTIVTPYTNATYTCGLPGEMETHTTTFHIIGEF